MARKPKNNVDYFPFLCKDGETLFYLEDTYGNDGFAVFIKLLRQLALTDFHHLDLSKKSTRMFLSSRCKVPVNILEAIILDLAELGKFDFELWDKYSIVWCQDFIDNIQDAYLKRTNDCIDKKGLLLLLTSKGIHKPAKSTPKPNLLPPKGDTNTHTIVEDIIPDHTIEEEKKEKKIKEPIVYSSEVHKCFDFCVLLFPESTRPNETQKPNWLDTIHKLHEIDGIPFDLIQKIVKKARADPFWSDNFLTITKLRKNNPDKIKYIVFFYEKFRTKNNGNPKGHIDPVDMQDYIKQRRQQEANQAHG